MEVHHHPNTERKKWTHYLWEFFMLFLAVTAGFFVENQREHMVEHKRELEYAHELYKEFKQDSTILSVKIAERKEKERLILKVCDYLKDSSLNNLPPDFYQAYTISLYLINRYAFEPKDGILSQMRSSGSLRYFKNSALQKLLGDISVSIANIRTRNEQEYMYWSSPIKPFMLKYYDFGWLTKLRSVNDTNLILGLVKNSEKYIPNEHTAIPNWETLDKREAVNMLLFYRQMMISTRTLQLNDYYTTCGKILKELREEYRMD